MTHVHYKFSSKLSYNTVVFDGPNITLCELKRLIMTREKLRATDCDLQITNAQTKEEYTDDESPIPKGSSVIVRRVPSKGVKSSSSAKNMDRSDAFKYSFGAFKSPVDDQKTPGVLPFFSKMANLANADVSEEDKIKVMMNQSCYDNTNYKRCGAALPANYTCYRCGSTGHHIRNCPISNQDKNAEPSLKIKKSTGIPRSFMVEVDDPTIKGAMLTNSGLYAIPAIDAEAYAVRKKKSVSQEQQPKEPADNPTPDELLCLICRDLLNDAVVIPCCGNSYCDDCVRTALLDSEDHVCPTCNQSDVSPDTLIANKFLRQAVNNFKKERGYTQSFKKTSSTSESQNSTPSPAPTPPPVYSQSQPQKSQAADIPTVTSSDSTLLAPSTSLVVVKSHDETPDRETDMKTKSAPAAAPSVQVSNTDPTAAHSQPIPLVTSVTQTAVGDTSHSSSASQSGQTPCWDRSTSATQSEGWTTISTHHPISSTYSPTQSPCITPSHIQTYLSVQQQLPLGSYPPGYSTATPPWTPGPSPQRAPIPSFTSSSTSSVPALVPKEWFMYHRRNKERTPHRGSSYSTSSQSYKSKSKSSRSPHSRSQSRSRPHSPYTSHRGFSSRSHSSHSYGYGYKRSHSPTPSSSSSPRSRHHSRSKSPSDQRKNRHHGRHHSKRSTSSSSSSRRKGEHSYTSGSSLREGPEWGLDTYLRWKQDYKEWCDKYFNSFVNHFQQLPPPLLPPPPQHHWPSQHNTGHSPPSSDSRSPPSSESSSTPSQLSSDSRSTPSTSHSDSHSTPTQSSSESCSGPSQELSKVYQHKNVDKNQNEDREGEMHKTENCNILKPASKKTDKHLKSKGYDRKRKEPKMSDKEKERKRWREKEEKQHKVKASQEAGSIDANRSRQTGRSKSQDSRSGKNRKRKNEEMQRNQRENILTETSPSLETDLSPKVFEREKQKKAVWKPQPVTEEDVWEGGVKVKPHKKISININLDVKRNQKTINKQAVEAKSNETIQDFEIQKEEREVHSQTDNDINKEKINEEMSDEKNYSWETFAEDEAGVEEDSDLWQCALTGVEEDDIKEGEEEKEEEMNCEEQEKSTFEPQRSRDHNERPNTDLDHSSSKLGRWQSVSCEEHQKSMTGVKCLEKYMKSRSLEKHNELVQVPHSRNERNAFEPEQQAKVPTSYTEKGSQPKRMRLVETEKDEELEISTSSDRIAVPSSGKQTHSTFDFDRKGNKKTERGRDGERESRKQHDSIKEERGENKERESSTFYRKYSSSSSQAFTSILEVKKKCRDRDQEENRSRERNPRQRNINIELDIEWIGKTNKSNAYSHHHHQNSHKDPTLSQYSSWTSLHSHSQSREKTSREDSPGLSGQNWTHRSQHPATPTAESSVGMTSENRKQRMINDRREEGMVEECELNRQTRDEGQADPESGTSSSTSHLDSKNEQRRDKNRQNTHRREKRYSTPDEIKTSKKKKNKDGRQEDCSEETLITPLYSQLD